MKKTNVGIFGLGRMGLTHFAILNQLINDANFIFIEPEKKIRFFLKANLNAKIIGNVNDLNESLEYALICTPPMFHTRLVQDCINFNFPNIFVEKPFGGINDDFPNLLNTSCNISVGYVYRFNPIINWIKDFINIDEVKKVEGFYFSNTIEKKPKGWRNSSYSGVTNEVGTHIIDLCVYLFGVSEPSINFKKYHSVISDVDDILVAELQDNHIKYHFHFDWVNKNYRKPVFKFVITMNDGNQIKFDQQKIEIFNNAGILLSRISVVDIVQKIPFYLRGVDFTRQMQDFVGSKNTIASLRDALITRKIIKKLITP